MLTTFDEIQALADDKLEQFYHKSRSTPNDKLQERIDRLRSRDQQIRQKLADHNITPLAVIPTEMWNRICAKTKLRVFAPDNMGRVPVSTDDAAYFMAAGRMASFAFWIAPWAGMGYLMSWNHAAGVIGVLALVLVYLALGAIRESRRGYEPRSAFISTQRSFTLALSRIYDLLPRQRIVDRMLDRAGWGLGHNSERALLVMPEPPAEVIPILARLTRVYPEAKVAIEPGGYSLREKPSRLIRHKLVDNVRVLAEDWSRWRAVNFPDPIFFVEDSGMTAIIAQYGPFPIERQTVEQALAAEDLIAMADRQFPRPDLFC